MSPRAWLLLMGFGAILAAILLAAPAQATPHDDLAVEAAFCHDVRAHPTVAGVRAAALQMIRIYGNADQAADVAMTAVTDICPDLKPVVMMAVDSPDWDSSGTSSGPVV